MASPAQMRQWKHALQQISLQSGTQFEIEDGIVIGLAQEGELDRPLPWASQAQSVKVQKKPSTKTSQRTSQKKPTTVPRQPLQTTSQKKPTSVPKQPLQKTCQKKPASVVKQLLEKKRTPEERKRIQSKAKNFKQISGLADQFKKRFISMK